MQIAELGKENENLHWRLQLEAKRLTAAEQQAAALQQQCMQASVSGSSENQRDKASMLQQEAKLQSLTSQNKQLQDKLNLTEAKLTEATKLQQQMHAERAEHDAAQRDLQNSNQQLQSTLREVNEHNQSLVTCQAGLEAQLQATKESMTQAQRAQQASAAAVQDSRQVESLKKENAAQAQHSRKLEHEVRALQQQLHDQMSQQQQSMHSMSISSPLASPTGVKMAKVQQQAELVAAENANLQMQCKQQAAELSQSQQDVQVISICLQALLCISIP